MAFNFDTDDFGFLIVALQSIAASNTLQGVIERLTAGIFALINSSVPDNWLSISVCQVSKQAVRLAYNTAADLYLVNNTIHAQLQQFNPLVEIRLANP